MNVVRHIAVSLALLLALASCERTARKPRVRIGSKAFTESVILGEVATQLADAAGAAATHKRQLGGSPVLYSALRRGDIDIYPEYTGTILHEIMADRLSAGEEQMKAALATDGIAVTAPLGFDNTYALGMREEVAERLGIGSISDLTKHPELRLGFSNEFMDRRDGWPGLRERYSLPQREVKGLDHDLAYRALQAGSIDAIDLYSTDAEIGYYHLRVLKDDAAYFPRYDAVYLYRADLRQRAPAIVAALEQMRGRIPQERMIAMNARAKLQHEPEAQVAADFLAETLGAPGQPRLQGAAGRIAQRTGEHLFLVSVSLAGAIAAAVPLGIVAFRRRRAGQAILALVAAIYTIPSLVLLVLMIPLLGIGAWPAIAALFLYSLLPIVRNTHEGLREIPPAIRESAEVLGLPPWARLLRIELPMASGTILAGIQTSAVINVGTATLGALIGAGGFGQPILTGIRLDDVRLILEGAIPAAVLALLAQGLFGLAERMLVPRGLRLSSAGH